MLCRRLPSPSLLRSSSIESLLEFSPRDVQKELSAKAPVLLAVLKAAASSCHSEPTQAVVAMAAAVLLKSRSKNMCKLQAVVSSLLYAGHSSKKVFTWGGGGQMLRIGMPVHRVQY